MPREKSFYDFHRALIRHRLRIPEQKYKVTFNNEIFFLKTREEGVDFMLSRPGTLFIVEYQDEKSLADCIEIWKTTNNRTPRLIPINEIKTMNNGRIKLGHVIGLPHNMLRLTSEGEPLEDSILIYKDKVLLQSMLAS